MSWSPQSGVIVVRAIARRTAKCRKVPEGDAPVGRAQVMIEAKVVDVTLNNAYQAE